ncbi:hypothetical protein Aduo_003296 [Ancylostoma duodenale]
MPAQCPVASAKVPAGPQTSAASASIPPRTKTLAMVAIGVGILAMLYIHYKKKKEWDNREVFENKVINPARVKKRSRRQTRRQGKGEKERSTSSGSSK